MILNQRLIRGSLRYIPRTYLAALIVGLPSLGGEQALDQLLHKIERPGHEKMILPHPLIGFLKEAIYLIQQCLRQRLVLAWQEADQIPKGNIAVLIQFLG